MCYAFPGRIVSVDGESAFVDFSGVKKSVNVSLIENPVAGDYVLVHAGFAIERLEAKRATELIKVFQSL